MNYWLLGIVVLDGLSLLALAWLIWQHRAHAPQRAHDHMMEIVDEGIALAEQASRASEKLAGGKLTGMDKRREAVSHIVARATRMRLKTTNAEAAKLIELRLGQVNQLARPTQTAAAAVETEAAPKSVADAVQEFLPPKR